MKNNFNDFLRDFLNEDFFWSNSTTYPFVRGLNNKVPVTKRDYSQNLPTTNVFEDEWSYKYELATPGFTKKELSVELENNMLTVKGERVIEHKDNGEYISKEFHSSKFYRTFPLPENVVADEIHAKVENGITTLFLPKLTPTKNKKENRKIEIS
tara:strand:- start:1700 stop:2161 length:462 start_codon:yes stop_codon:yes gene_type:complete